MSINLLERTAVSRTWNPKLACSLMLGLVFLVGATAGALLMDLRIQSRRGPAFDTPAGKIAYMERVQKELNLTPAQSEQMQSVLNDFWQYYRTVLSDSKQRVEQLLDEEQKRKFEKLLQQR